MGRRVRRPRGEAPRHAGAKSSSTTVECPLHLDRVTLPRRGTVLLEDLGNLAANELYDPDGAGTETAGGDPAGH